jgi:hypothetical protein
MAPAHEAGAIFFEQQESALKLL